MTLLSSGVRLEVLWQKDGDMPTHMSHPSPTELSGVTQLSPAALDLGMHGHPEKPAALFQGPPGAGRNFGTHLRGAEMAPIGGAKQKCPAPWRRAQSQREDLGSSVSPSELLSTAIPSGSSAMDTGDRAGQVQPMLHTLLLSLRYI